VWKKVGWLGEKLCFGFGALFTLIVIVQAAMTACKGGAYVLLTLLGLGVTGGVTIAGLRFLAPHKAFPVALFSLRFFIALGVILIFGAQPVQDFQTMYDAACQVAQGSREYLETDYFYNWAYQTGFVAYEALVIRIFGESLLPLQVCNALWMAGTGCLVYGIARRFLSETGAMTISLVYALYPAPYFLAAVLTNQHIATFFYYMGFWLLVRKDKLNLPWAVLGGLCLSLGNVMRPLGAVIVLALLCWVLVRLCRWRGPGVLHAGGLLLAVGVTYFISTEFFSWLVQATGLNPEGLSNNLPMWKFVLGFNLESGGAWNQADYNAYYLLPREEAGEQMSQVVNQRLSSLGLGGFLELFWKKSRTMWGSLEYLYWGFGHLNGDAQVLGGLTLSQCLNVLNYLNQGVFLGAFGLAGVALVFWLWKGCGKGLRLPVMLGFLLCGYYSVHLLIEVQARYRYFLMPAVFLMAGAGAELLWRRWKEGAWPVPESGGRKMEKSPLT
jgi:hypothetical protein